MALPIVDYETDYPNTIYWDWAGVWMVLCIEFYTRVFRCFMGKCWQAHFIQYMQRGRGSGRTRLKHLPTTASHIYVEKWSELLEQRKSNANHLVWRFIFRRYICIAMRFTVGQNINGAISLSICTWNMKILYLNKFVCVCGRAWAWWCMALWPTIALHISLHNVVKEYEEVFLIL